MAIYDYECTDCGVFTAMRPMAMSDKPCECPQCGTDSRRVFLRMPALANMDSGRRSAHATNEKSRHEPGLASKRHGSNCSCCKPNKSAATTATAANGAKSFPGKRPWMISH